MSAPRAAPVPAPYVGSTIAVVSPSAPDAGRCPRRLKRATANLAAVARRPVRMMPHARDDGIVAGPVAARLSDLHAAFAASDVTTVLSAVGGNNSNELLAGLDYLAMARTPTLLVGGSDVTAILLAVWQRCGIVTVFGPQLLPQFGDVGGCLPLTVDSWRATVETTLPPGALPCAQEFTDEFLEWDLADNRPRALRATDGPRVVKAGFATGPVCAANLQTLLRLAGTPYFPDLGGCVLLLESTHRFEPAMLRAELEQLRQIGVLDAVAGIGFGRFVCTDPIGAAAEDDLLSSVLTGRGPLVSGLDIGHTDPVLCIPNGLPARLAADERVVLTIDAAAVVTS
jgi:muramoyltetrapeptide carboxypeptidase LdcA involved in peptidoglycan recycling